MTRRQTRILGVIAMLVILGAAVGLTLYALNRNVNLFFVPSDELPMNVTIRLGGIVVPGSVKRSPDSLDVKFAIEDGHYQMWVVYQGILPDLFREGQAVVAVGKMENADTLHATQILAKHDENYVPRDLSEALTKQQEKKP